MSDLLHRMISRARDASGTSAHRIKPLLAPRFAPTHPDGYAGAPHEVTIETDAPTRARSDVRAAKIDAMSAPIQHEEATPTAAKNIARPETPLALPASETRQKGVSMTSPAQDTPSGAFTEETTEAAAKQNIIQPLLSATPPIVPMPQRLPRATAETPHVERSVVRDAPAIEEHSQTITISIGRVEVRNASAPAPSAPRKPPFRPGLSLDAFLGRNGSGER